MSLNRPTSGCSVTELASDRSSSPSPETSPAPLSRDLDYRYPIAGVDIEWRNFALFSDNGRNREVFRIAGIPQLFGVNATFDPRADRLVILGERHLDGRQAERCFDHFLSGAMPPAGARVALGEWRDGSVSPFETP